MPPLRRSIALVVLLALATAVSVAVSRDRGSGAQRQVETDADAPEAQPADGPALVLVRRRGGLPDRWVRRLRRHPDVAAMARTSRTQLLLRRSERPDGRAVDAPRSGYALLLDTLAVTPRTYARVTPEPDRAAVRTLRPGRVLMSRSSAELRGLGVGDRMVLSGGRHVRVTGIVADGAARDAEVVADARAVGATRATNGQVSLTTDDPAAIDRAVPDDPMTRVAVIDPAAPATPGPIIRPLSVKQRFGEFAVGVPLGSDWIRIEPAWVRRNITSRPVPILGSVTCHRAMFGPLRRALGMLQRRGLSRLVDQGDYAGCFAPRRIASSGSLSLHAWGLAVDVNASTNAQGRRPRQDRRLVRAFEDAGFAWGGRWPTAPDGMHFELHGAPEASR